MYLLCHVGGKSADIPAQQLMKGNFQEMQVAFTNYYESMTFSSKYSEYVCKSLPDRPQIHVVSACGDSFVCVAVCPYCATASGGGGMGFGVQFDCNDQVLLSIGGGVGAGYSGTMTNTTGGSGGGGGMQVTLNGQVRPHASRTLHRPRRPS